MEYTTKNGILMELHWDSWMIRQQTWALWTKIGDIMGT